MSDLDDDEAKAKAANQRYLLMFLGVVFLAGAIYLWTSAWNTYRLAHARGSTTCTVLAGDIDEVRDSKDHTSYGVRLRVAYEIDGRRYEASDVSEHQRSRSESANQLQAYKRQGTVPCWYVEGSPDLVAVFPKTTSSYVTELIAGLVALLVPVAGFVRPWSRARRR